MNSLLDTLRSRADPPGTRPTPVAGLSTVRADRPSGLVHDIARPLVCLVAQGRKQVSFGQETHTFGAGDSLLIACDVPTASQVVEASGTAPYRSLVVELDVGLLTDLSVEIGAARLGEPSAVQVRRTDDDVADAAVRLLRLADDPSAMPVLRQGLMREVHYWLLVGRHGPAIRRLGWPDGHVRQIGRAVALLRRDYRRSLSVDEMAAAAGMSPSSFHEHFRASTSLSPIQFQKRLRLIEARRLMLAEGESASAAAYAVGYGSVPHFTRDYGRLFGSPPARETVAVRLRGAALEAG